MASSRFCEACTMQASPVSGFDETLFIDRLLEALIELKEECLLESDPVAERDVLLPLLREVAFDEELIELEESVVRREGRHVSGKSWSWSDRDSAGVMLPNVIAHAAVNANAIR